MTPKKERHKGYDNEWRHWNRWSTWEKISSVGVVLIVLLGHIFFNYILPRLAENERNASGSTPAASAPSKTAPNLDIPRPDVSIPPNPNTRP